jgi:hypothetical protein
LSGPGCQTLVCPKTPSAPVENKPRIKGQNKEFRPPPRPAARFQTYPLLERGHTWPVIPRRQKPLKNRKHGRVF